MQAPTCTPSARAIARANDGLAEPAKIVNPLLTPASGLSSVCYGRMNAAKPSLVASIIRAGAA
jgi:hypothetical protein